MDTTRFVDLLSVSKRALQLGQGVCVRASEIADESSASADLIDAVLPKLDFLHGEIGRQLDVMSIMAGQCGRRAIDVMHRAARQHDELYRASRDVDEVVEQLQSRRLVPGLHPPPGAQGSPKLPPLGSSTASTSSLADFIDSEGIKKSKDKAASLSAKCGSEAKILADALREIAAATHATVDKFRERLKSSLSLDSPERTRDIDQIGPGQREQEDLSQRLAGALNQLIETYEQGSRSVRALREQSDDAAESLAMFEARVKYVPEIIDEMHEYVGRLDLLAMTIRDMAAAQVALLEAHKSLFNDVMGFIKSLGHMITACSASESTIAEAGAELKTEIDELCRLFAWYQLFREAYEGLIIEIARRHTAHTNIYGAATQLMAKLAALCSGTDFVDFGNIFDMILMEFLLFWCCFVVFFVFFVSFCVTFHHISPLFCHFPNECHRGRKAKGRFQGTVRAISATIDVPRHKRPRGHVHAHATAFQPAAAAGHRPRPSGHCKGKARTSPVRNAIKITKQKTIKRHCTNIMSDLQKVPEVVGNKIERNFILVEHERVHVLAGRVAHCDRVRNRSGKKIVAYRP